MPVARPDPRESRLFPVPGEPAASAPPPFPRPGTRAARLGRDPRAGVGRLVWLWDQAAAAERAGRVGRANFWWAEGRRQLDRLPPDSPAWADATRQLPGRTPGEVRSRLIREVLLDTHLGFVNGNAHPTRRAFHMAAARRAFADAGLTDAQAADLELLWSVPDRDGAGGPALLGELDALAARYPNATRVRRLKADVCRRWADDPAVGFPARAEWADQLARLEPDDPRWRNLRVRLFRDGVRESAHAGRWVEAADRAAAFARACPEVAAPETDPDYYLRAAARAALGRAAPPPPAPAKKKKKAPAAAPPDPAAAVESAGRLRDRPDPDAAAHARAVGWQAVRLLCGAKDWAAAAAALTRLAPVFPPDDGAATGRLRRALGRRALAAVPDGYDRGLTALEAVLGQFPDDPDLHARAVEAVFTRVRERADAVRVNGGDPAGSAREKAAVFQTGINLLTRALGKNPALYPAAEALPVLHFFRAVQLANGSRPADALLELEYVAAYDPQFDGLSEARAKVQEVLADARRLVLAVTAAAPRYEGGYTVRSVLNAEGEALAAQTRQGTGPRDRFVRSAEPAAIRGRVEAARRLRLWLRAGLPPAGGAAGGRALEAAAERLAARNPETAADLLLAWVTVLAENPDLADNLREVGPDNLLALFTPPADPADSPDPATLIPAVELDWLDRPPRHTGDVPLEPEPEPAAVPAADSAAAPGPVPRIEVRAPAAAHTDAEDPPPEFWLFSRRDIGSKAAALAAALLLATSGVVVAFDAAARSGRDAAYTDLAAAARALDPAAGQAAVGRFRAARTVLASDPRAAAVDRLEPDIAHWPALRDRDAAFARLSAAVAAYDPDGTRAAADDFLALPAPRTDPREDAARRARAAAAEFPRRKERDRAYDDLLRAAGGKAAADAVAAADRFLAAPPLSGTDPREPQVTRLRFEAAEFPARRARDGAYDQLVAALAARPVDDPGAVAAADAFLAARSAAVPDPREAQVKALRAYAAETPGRRTRDDATDRLKQAVTAGDRPAALAAAETFLVSAAAAAEPDARTGWVKGEYARAFSEWERGRGGPPGPDDGRRVERYKALMAPGSAPKENRP